MLKGWLYMFLFCLFWRGYSQTFIQRTYYDEARSKLKEVITLTRADSVPNGPYLGYYLSGSLSAEGYYKDNISDSTWIFYYENGRKRSEGKYRKGQQAGKWAYYFENGNIKAKGVLKAGIKHGSWTYYFENGNEKSSGMYFNDVKEGLWNYYYEDEVLKAQAFYERGSGIYKEFYPSGHLKMEGKNVHEKGEGLWQYYYESGEPEARGHYSDGLRDGRWLYYHKNGTVAAEGLFENGEKTGTWKYYYPDGTISSEGEMHHSRQEGTWKLYYPSGELKGEGHYDQGSGDYIEYYSSGQQKARGKITEGKKEGKWIYYNEEGVEDGVAFFQDGAGQYTGYYPDGNIKMSGKIKEGKRVGEWTLYNPDGSYAGVYRPIYEDEKPIVRSRQLSQDTGRDKHRSGKPEYKFKNKKLRYFNPRINEYVGVIIGANPLWMPLGKLPVAVEYYFQERLGYEVEFTVHRQPFFKKNDKVPYNELYLRGSSIELRQKLYSPDTKLGMFYFGHQVAGSLLLHQLNAVDTSGLSEIEYQLSANEQRFSYGLFVGNRWVQRTEDSGFTIDFRIGLGIGRRTIVNNYNPSPTNKNLFSELNRSKIYFPIIFGVNIGFVAPKRRKYE